MIDHLLALRASNEKAMPSACLDMGHEMVQAIGDQEIRFGIHLFHK